MNTLEITNAITGTDDFESTTCKVANRSRSTVTRAVWGQRLRSALFAFFVLVMAGMAWSMHHSIREVEAEIDQVSANLELPSF